MPLNDHYFDFENDYSLMLAQGAPVLYLHAALGWTEATITATTPPTATVHATHVRGIFNSFSLT